MGDVVARSSEPALGRIKLAWWREQLEALDDGVAPAEPRLQALAGELLPRGVSGAAITEIEPGWATLLDETPDPQLIARRGARLFEMTGELLGATDPKLGDAGALYALSAVARRGIPELISCAQPYARALTGHRFPRRLRGLTALTRAAVRDLTVRDLNGPAFEPEASPARAAAMLAHRWSGLVLR